MLRRKAYAVFLIYSGVTAALFSMIFTVSNVYYVSVARLDPLQLVLIGTVLEGSVFLFEVPTGVVADLYSRRLSVIIGLFLIGVGFLIEGTWPLFGTILLAQVFWGVGFTFTSGANQAWIVDEIGEEQAGKIFLHSVQIEQLAGFGGLLLGAALGLLRINLPIQAGGALFFGLAVVLIVVMPENGFKPTPAEDRTTWGQMVHTFRSGLCMVRRRPALASILGVGLFYGLYSEGFDRLWTAHLIQRFAIPEAQQVLWFSAIRGVAMLLASAANGLAHRRLDLTRTGALARAITLISLGLVASLVLFGSARSLALALAVYWIIGVLRSLQGPLYTTWVNQRLDSQVRATVISMSSQVDALGQITGGPVLGLIARLVSIPAGLYASAGLLSPVLLLLSRANLKGEAAAEQPPVA